MAIKETRQFFLNLLLVFGAVFLTLIVFELSLQAISSFYIKKNESLFDTQSSLSKKSEVRILCLGESTTALGLDDSYPRVLEKKLNEKFNLFDFKVINRGRTGVNSFQILSSLEEDLKKYRPQVVITMIGINDFWNRVTPEEMASTQGSVSFWDKFKVYKILSNFVVNLRFFDTQQATRHTLSPNERFYFETPQERTSWEKSTLIDEEGNFTKGIFYSYVGDHNKAAQSFEQYIQSDKPLERLEKVTTFISENEFSRQIILTKYPQFPRWLEMIRVLAPNNPRSYEKLAMFYMDIAGENAKRKYSLYLKKAIEKKTQNPSIYHILYSYYKDQKEKKRAENVLRSGLNTPNGRRYTHLWRELIGLCIEDKRNDEANRLIDAYAREFEADKLTSSHVGYWREQLKGRSNILDEKRELPRDLLENQMTQLSYKKIAEIISKYGSRHIVMQYPLRDIAALAKTLETFPKIIFVNNKPNFELALNKGTYEDFFYDRFAGDFGHFTRKGSEMIAENIISEMIKKKEYYVNADN